MSRRRTFVMLSAVGVLVLAALMAADDKKPAPGKLLVLEWAAKSSLEKPPVGVLIEFGGKDVQETDWSGRAVVAGAKVVHREGYRFRPKAGDKLTEPDAWQAKTHRGLRVPPKQPAVAKMEPLATVGVVLHLDELKPDAELTIEPKAAERGKATVALKDVLTGRPQSIWNGLATVRLVSTATPVATDRKLENDFPAACYGPDGSLWVAYVGYHIQDESRRIEQANLKEQPKDFKALYTPEFHDQILLRGFRAGKWTEPATVTSPNEDVAGIAMAAVPNGDVRVFAGLRDAGAMHSAKIELSRKESSKGPGPLGFAVKVTNYPGGPNLRPASVTESNGAEVYGWFAQGSSEPGPGGGVLWPCSVSAPSRGECAVAFEEYRDGDYDIVVNVPDSRGTHPIRVAESSRFEARPSLAYDPQGRLWIAYEEGPELWGRDFGALAQNVGNPLYSSRSVRVVCLDQNGKLMKPVAELPTSNVALPKTPYGGQAGPNYERNENRYAYPKLGIDGKGRVWLTYRQKFGTRYATHPGSYWLSFARRLDGDHWTDPIELSHSDGLLDYRPVLLPHKDGGLLIIHNTDGRLTTPDDIHNQIWMSHLDLPGDPVEPKLVPHDPGKKDPQLVERAKHEQQAVQRIRDYRIDHQGQKLRLLRGEFHRHTEISWDGGPDGSLEDMFRYAIDVAQMDWIGNGDHDSGAGREYCWWLIQKFTDAYTMPGRFTGMFTYERSVAYPHGHRNCVFAKRGVRTLPRLAEADAEKRVGAVHADDTKMLYRYLHELGGICASHTSATSMGTDWRDNDPEVEPFVEIYQGDRMSYEMQDAPRAGYDPKSKKEPANIAGWYPAGFIDEALGKKGYKLAFESSSDHWSTHISYCIVLAEKNDRQAILEAMKKRHVYGATDDIICDVRSGGHIMGDSFDVMAAPKLDIRVIGTKKLAKIDILKDSKVVESVQPVAAEYQGAWTDPQPSDGTHYYYIRVQQDDGELAWTSPMWVTMKK
jgi:hypothetical protein